MKLKKILEKTAKLWDFIWHGESVESYIAFLLFCIIFVPLVWQVFLSFMGLFGIADVTAVMTSSMVHSKNTQEYFFNWFADRNISIENFPFKNGFLPTDAMIIMKIKSPLEIKVGDVVVYKPCPTCEQIIHRVVEIRMYNSTDYHYSTKGDNNPGFLPFETDINYSQIKGKAVLRIPLLGIPRTLLYYAMRFLGL